MGFSSIDTIVAPEGGSDDVDVGRLERSLKALANPARLQLLKVLRTPRLPSEIRVQAPDKWGGLREDRMLSRSTVAEHVAQLEELGLLRRLDETGQVVVDRQAVFQLVSELGQLAKLRPLVEVDVAETVPVIRQDRPVMPSGPKLVLVSGPDAGTAFPLEGDGPWRLGRGPEVDLRLSYDPHVSAVHVTVSKAEDGLYWVEALPGATNPARLDFSEFAPGTPRPLIPGCVLSVGSSRFVFKAV